MSIFNIKKRDNPFVQVDKGFIFDDRLSYKAKGILLYLLSRPPDWQVYESEITKHCSDGIKSVKTGIKELLLVGYITRHKVRDDAKRFMGYEYNVYEQPTNPVNSTVVLKTVNGKRHTNNNDKTGPSVNLISAGKIGKKEKLIPHNAEQYNKLQYGMLNRVNYPNGFPPEKQGSPKDWKMG